MISPELLRRFSLFGGLPPEIFEAIAQFSDELKLEPDTYLFEEGDTANKLYLVLDGTVDLLINMDEEGRMRNDVETIVAGEVVGWSALIEPHQYTLSAVTMDQGHFIEIDAGQLREYLTSNPEWGFMIMSRVAKIISLRLVNMRMRFMSFGQ